MFGITTNKDAEDIEILKKQQTSALSVLTKIRNKLAGLMADNDNLHAVKTCLGRPNVLYQSYQDAHEGYHDALTSEEEKIKQIIRLFEGRQNSVLNFCRQIMEWVSQAEQALTDSHDSVSTVSKRTRTTQRTRLSHLTRSGLSGPSPRAREAARMAELEIEILTLEQKHVLKTQEDSLRIETELAKAKARERIYADGELRKSEAGSAVVKQQPQQVKNTAIDRQSSTSSHIRRAMGKQEVTSAIGIASTKGITRTAYGC